MKKYLLLLLLFVLSGQLFSQFSASQLINEVKTLAIRNASAPLSYEDVEGSPYYSPEYITSTVFLKNNTYVSVPLRYDMYMDEMEFMRDNKIQWLIKREIRYIRYGSDMLFVKPSITDSASYGYFFFKADGKNKLVCRKSVKFYPYVPPKGYADGIPDRFERNSDEFYIQLESNSAALRIKTRKELTNLFSNNKPALDFIRKEKIKSDDFDDLQKLITYLNSQ